MGQYITTGKRAFTVDGAYSRATRMKLSSTANQLTVAGPADIEVGTLDAATFAAGNNATLFLSSAQGTQEFVASGAIAVNSLVYPDANGQITATANGLVIGIALSAASASGDIIEVLRIPGVDGKLYTAVSTTDTVTNTTAETAFAQQFSVPANFLVAGSRLKITAQGTITSHNASDTLNVKVYVGSNVVASTGAINNAANDVFYFTVDVVIRTITSSGTIVATGTVADGAPGTATAKPFVFASATLDSTVAELIKLTATWSAASASDIVRLDILNVEKA